MNNNKLVMTVEVLGAYLTKNLDDYDSSAFAINPQEFVADKLNWQSDFDISVVSNTESTVHLTLPYYGLIKHTAETLTLSDLEDTSGGNRVIFGSQVLRRVNGRYVEPPCK